MSMKMAWLLLLITSFTDGLLATAGGFSVVLATFIANPDTQIRWYVFAGPVLAGFTVWLRTIQQALRADSANATLLRGGTPPPVGGA